MTNNEVRWRPGIERTFRMVENGIFRELMFYFLHKVNEGGDIVSTKIDKVEHGRLYKIARQGERSLYGQYDWILPDGQEVVLIGLG